MREAVAAANVHVGADTVHASTVTGTITLAEVPGFNFMEVTDALTIIGPGADLLTVDANTDTSGGYGESRFFSVTDPNADFTIEGLTLLNGRTVGNGRAIYSSADLTLDGVTIQDARSATKGGGISVSNADVRLTNSTISGCFPTTNGGSEVSCEMYPPASGSGAPVRFCAVAGGGHSMPSVKHVLSRFAERFVGRQNHDIEGARLAWEFLKSFTTQQVERGAHQPAHLDATD